MLPDRVSNPRPLALESDALPTSVRGPAVCAYVCVCVGGGGAYLYSQVSGRKFYFKKKS